MTNPKHTTEEYLARIEKRIAEKNKEIQDVETKIESHPVPRFDTPLELQFLLAEHTKLHWELASLLANRDVLVRHSQADVNWLGIFLVCSICESQNPCPTYLDIASKLDEVM